MMMFLSVFIGGGIGSILRWFTTSKIENHWGVMLVNIIGAMLIGMAYQYFLSKSDFRPEVKAFIITGLLGGFTTFSTYVLDFHNLVNNQKVYEAMIYLIGSIFVGFIFLFFGIKLMKFLMS